jgi:CRP-like cAMP-binding protein
MYFIEEGDAEAVIKGVGVVMSYKRGDFFGELALMTAEPRSATVRRGARARVIID